jgi:hypothetical protein
MINTLATLTKSTKQGISTFYFVETDGSYSMFGGCTPKCFNFKNIDELRKAYTNWIAYGYMPSNLQVQAKAYISNPWESDLPVHLQHELEELSV